MTRIGGAYRGSTRMVADRKEGVKFPGALPLEMHRSFDAPVSPPERDEGLLRMTSWEVWGGVKPTPNSTQPRENRALPGPGWDDLGYIGRGRGHREIGASGHRVIARDREIGTSVDRKGKENHRHRTTSPSSKT